MDPELLRFRASAVFFFKNLQLNLVGFRCIAYVPTDFTGRLNGFFQSDQLVLTGLYICSSLELDSFESDFN